MSGRLRLSAVADAFSSLPGPAKWIGSLLAFTPVLLALTGIGWAGWKTPGKLDQHLAQMDTVRIELKSSDAEKAARDVMLLAEQRETNRLLRCTLTSTGDLDRARCAAQKPES